MNDGRPAHAVTERLEHGSAAGTAARELVLGLLADHRTTDELRHDAALVAYELVANAVVHGTPDADGTIELSCELEDDELVVRVRDAGSGGSVAPRPLEPEAANGRGLAIVDALSSSWSVDRSEGTVVTARVPLTWWSA
jgi:anti-sigma regulatory factor (Ser/Thr protein kinase)